MQKINMFQCVREKFSYNFAADRNCVCACRTINQWPRIEVAPEYKFIKVFLVVVVVLDMEMEMKMSGKKINMRISKKFLIQKRKFSHEQYFNNSFFMIAVNKVLLFFGFSIL